MSWKQRLDVFLVQVGDILKFPIINLGHWLSDGGTLMIYKRNAYKSGFGIRLGYEVARTKTDEVQILLQPGACTQLCICKDIPDARHYVDAWCDKHPQVETASFQKRRKTQYFVCRDVLRVSIRQISG